MQPYAYNRERTKRPGVFQNAVYSKVVCAADDPSVRKGIDEDLRTILKKPSNSRRWNQAWDDDSKSTERFDLQKIRMPGRGLSFLRKRDEMVVRRVSHEEIGSKSSPKMPPQNSSDLINHFSDYVSANQIAVPPKPPQQQEQSASKVCLNMAESGFEIDNLLVDDNPKEGERGISLPESNANRERQRQQQKKQHLTPDPVVFSKTLPINEIVVHTVEALPKLTLRNGHPLTYSSLVTDICRKSLLRIRNENRKEEI